MARPRKIDPIIVEHAQLAAATAISLLSLRESQAVLLPALLGATLEQTATILGVSRASVARLQSVFRKKASATQSPSRNWGGRRQSLLSKDEERAFLKPWLEEVASGHRVAVSSIRAALAQQLGKPVRSSVIYRLLARHGWRKVASATRPPKGNLVD